MPENILLYCVIGAAALSLGAIILCIVILRSLAEVRAYEKEQSALLKTAVNTFLAESKESEGRHYEVLGAISKAVRPVSSPTAEAPPVAADNDAIIDVLVKLAKIDGKIDDLSASALETRQTAHSEIKYKAELFDKLVALVQSGADKKTIMRELLLK